MAITTTSNKKPYMTLLSEIKQRDVQVLLKKQYRGIWETAIKKYSDSAHFIYELLQNADDAKATKVEFDLQHDGLYFKHNGSIRFTISDPNNEDFDTENGTLGHINAITSIGNSTKIDEQKIGKFGIGFKAVFAYSFTPHIYDDTFNFQLENYIVPIEVTPLSGRRKKGETLFYFPFNHPTKNKLDAYREIENKLDSLFQPVLFLNSLTEVKWTSQSKKGVYSKTPPILAEKFDNIEASLIEVKNNGVKEKLWIFSNAVIHKTLKSSHKISVGFFLSNNKLKTDYNNYQAFCFFPTKEDTKLGFIIQAPFLLTDNREGIKNGEPWNIGIMELTAKLAANSFSILKEIGIRDKTTLIDDSILDIIPYNESEFSTSSFKPFFSSIREKFRSEQLLPGKIGEYFITNKAYWASDSDLADIFSNQQISDLFENPNSGWVFLSKGQKQLNQANRPLEIYLSSLVKDIIDPKKLLRRITAKFIESQTEEWLIKFYTYLGGRKHLWSDADKLALKRPILLNQNRKAVIPFNDALTTANIFLPPDNPTTHDTIYKPLLDSIEALDFFKSLGLDKPDLKAEIFNTIIPLFSSDFDYNNSDKVLEYFESFLNYYDSCAATPQADFIKSLKNVHFIAARNRQSPDKQWFAIPSQVYFNSENLNSYFSNSEETYFLDDDFYVEYIDGKKREVFLNFLTSLGIASIPRVVSTSVQANIENKEAFGLDNFEISQKYYQQTIIDKQLDGLSTAVQNIELETSIIIWEFLLVIVQGRSVSTLKNFFSGTFTFYPKYNTTNRQVYFDSTLESTLLYGEWLFNKDKVRKISTELKVDTLNDAYNLDDPFANVLLEFLGIHNPDANLNLDDAQKQALAIGKRILEGGITQNELDDFINMVSARKRTAIEPETTTEESFNVTNENDIDATLANLRKGIKKKREILPKEGGKETSTENEVIDDNLPEADQDEYSKPSIDVKKKIDRLKEQTESQIENLTRIEKLNEIVSLNDKYSYAWFQALIELEYLNSSEANSQGKQLSIQFTKVEREPDTARTLILKHPSRYIPQSIEDIGDLQIRIYIGDVSHPVTVEVVSVKEYTLRAKLKKSVDISHIDLDKVTRVAIDVKNPVFILDELRKAFNSLKFDDDFNLQKNLSEKIRFIFGPPGTGKTTYLAEKEIIPFMQKESELKVLVLTPTNKAADVLTKRIIEKMGGDESYYHWLIRFGTTADAELESSLLVKDKTYDIRLKPRNTTITTIARFAYDYFQPDVHDERLHLKFLQWDYIVIDEASMINLAAIAYALFQKPNVQFIIAGDPFQIQPITQIEQWKDENIYSMVKLDKFVNPTTTPHQFEIINLSTQYRSIPTIGCLFSHFTYGGDLKNYRKFEDQKQLKIDGLDFKDINLIKFPVSKFESIFKPNTLNKSNYQIYSALFTVEFLNKLMHQIENTHKTKFKIGVICPYKAQATLVEKIIAQQHFEYENSEVQIGTIHGFQGDECDIIIAIFNPSFSISKNPNSFLNKQNILNVSISRARDYLFILMPDDRTKDIDNLYKVKRIEKLIYKHAEKRHSVYESEVIEEVMFGSKTYVIDNSFATSHQSVNVYSKPDKKYEVRCEEIALDVQIKI